MLTTPLLEYFSSTDRRKTHPIVMHHDILVFFEIPSVMFPLIRQFIEFAILILPSDHWHGKNDLKQ